ncbi:MAG TPA: hypothetical protein VHB48_13895 [Chitinophagaceae bacterium]|nr:hypothetical protein [Chitinophagaceae bacterium]
MQKLLPLLTAFLCMGLFGRASFTPVLKNTTSAHQNDSISTLQQSMLLNYIHSLSLKEKLRLYRNLRKIQHGKIDDKALAEIANHNAQLGYAFALTGIVLFYFFIPSFILSARALKLEKEHPGLLTAKNLRRARFAKAMSVTGFIIVVICAFLLVIFLSNLALSCR